VREITAARSSSGRRSISQASVSMDRRHLSRSARTYTRYKSSNPFILFQTGLVALIMRIRGEGTAHRTRHILIVGY
jgi:hypothetical protein